ncbi:methionyl-tRNA formyltransferase [Exiguobacterium sp. S3]|uniref:methionyl-tRNA formyltransferase n=1 Tax=Exiguobacterium sp. S3 TaxID=483245 RepID=UPI001BE885C6|nr:methionyl-tRNA formyltransferase [Exiguobacterium sp. S3]
MRMIFCGFGKLGKVCLDTLIQNKYDVVFVLTHKDMSEHSVDSYCEVNNIPYSYIDVRKEGNKLLEQILIENSIYLVSVNYRYILPSKIINSVEVAINLHGSLLPKYRGRTPHVWSIINGETYSGVTSHLIDEGVDTGNIIKQIRIKIEEDDTGYDLLIKFEKEYPDLLLDSLTDIQSGILPKVQNESQGSYFGRRTPEMGYIDFFKNTIEVINFVRAQAKPYPGAYYYLKNGSKIIIHKIIQCSDSISNLDTIGVIEKIDSDYYVRCKDNVLKIVDYEII